MDPSSALFAGLEPAQAVLLTHGDSVETVAPGFRAVAWSGDIVAGMEDPARRIYAVQFHPEVTLTTNGVAMFRSFLFGIACCAGDFTVGDRQRTAIQEIQRTVGDKKVLVLVSGGVDSSVCAALLSKALQPAQIVALHIDNGFMRLNESSVGKKRKKKGERKKKEKRKRKKEKGQGEIRWKGNLI